MIPNNVTPQPQVTLRRQLHRWDLTAIGVNQVIGSGIFLLPSAVAAQIGAWSIPAFVLAGVASMLVALCFAEVGSRFASTGGPYLYTRAAFGRFVGFEVGWMQWVTRVTSWAGVANGIPLALGFYTPALSSGVPRIALIIGLFVVLGAINVRGIKHSAWTVNVLTVGKLAPLAIFIVVGLFYVELERFTAFDSVSWPEASAAGLLLIFAFGGFEVVPVPAGETSDPRGQIPFAMVSTIVVISSVMLLAHVVAMGTLSNLTASMTPLADSAVTFMGAAGALLIGLGSVISMTGNNAGQALTASRMLFTLAENEELPPYMARIHQTFRTPATAIVITTGISLALALSGSFVALATASAVTRLVIYTGVCAATLRLRHPRYEGIVQPPRFTTPMGFVVPLLGIVVSVTLLVGASAEQLFGGIVALGIGAALFFLNDSLRRSRQRSNLLIGKAPRRR